jgi:hypothetical protein
VHEHVGGCVGSVGGDPSWVAVSPQQSPPRLSENERLGRVSRVTCMIEATHLGSGSDRCEGAGGETRRWGRVFEHMCVSVPEIHDASEGSSPGGVGSGSDRCEGAGGETRRWGRVFEHMCVSVPEIHDASEGSSPGGVGRALTACEEAKARETAGDEIESSSTTSTSTSETVSALSATTHVGSRSHRSRAAAGVETKRAVSRLIGLSPLREVRASETERSE